PLANEWFGDVIEHEALASEFFNKPYGRWKLPRIDQHVIRQVEGGQARDAATEVVAHHECVVRLVLNDMAHSHQPFLPGELAQLCLKVWRSEVNPPHHSADKFVLPGELEQPAGLVEALARLDGHAPG